MPPEDKPRFRKIHIDLPVEIHQKLRVKAAVEDKSIQVFVAELVTEAVEDVVITLNDRTRIKRE